MLIYDSYIIYLQSANQCNLEKSQVEMNTRHCSAAFQWNIEIAIISVSILNHQADLDDIDSYAQSL